MDPIVNNGIGEGVGNFFKGLIGVKKMVDDSRHHDDTKSQKERALNIDAARYGLLRGPDDSYTQSPEALEQKEFKQKMLNMGLMKNALELEKLKREQSPEALDEAARGKVHPNQWTAGGYANRLQEAEQGLIGKKDFDPTSKWNLPSQLVPERMKSAGRKQQEQAELNFLTAQLRKESGAAISESEIANAKNQYFPQPGDTPDRITQKERSRAMALRNLQAEAGPAMKYMGQSQGLLGQPDAQVAQRGLIPDGNSASVAQSPKQPTPRDQAMINAARQHPEDPDAQAILQHWGVR